MNASELLKKAKEKTIGPEEFLKELSILATGLKRNGYLYSREEIRLYRTRVFETDVRPAAIEELSYPPIEKTVLQRANKQGEQVFYSSLGLATGLVESKVKVNQYIAISEWINTEELVLQGVGLLPNHQLSNEVEKLYHDIFTWPTDEMYEYTSIIASHLMNGTTICGLAYPSIASKQPGDNIVLLKKFVDNGLEFVHASLYQVNSISENEEYTLREIAMGLSESNGRLKWHEGKVNYHFDKWASSSPS